MINSYVKHEDLISEMTVVRNEFERGENSPQNLLDQRVMAVAFDWHNYGKSTIGNRSDIERVPIDRLKAFYTRLSARQRHAGDRRQVRRKEGSAVSRRDVGQIAKPREARQDIHRRTAAGWRARCHTAARGRLGGRRGALITCRRDRTRMSPPWKGARERFGCCTGGPVQKALVETKKATSVAAGVNSWHDAGNVPSSAEAAEGGLDRLRRARRAN